MSTAYNLERPIATGGLTAKLRVQVRSDNRVYMRGRTYEIRQLLHELGFKWDGMERAWWTFDQRLAGQVARELHPTNRPKRLKELPKLKVLSPLSQLRKKHEGLDVRCALCSSFVPGDGDMGRCQQNEGPAYRDGVCLQFSLPTSTV